jgi:DnaJ-class molecular chaperone
VDQDKAFRLPALCATCKNQYPSGFTVRETKTLTVADMPARRTCPKCGASGKVLDGLYTLNNDGTYTRQDL